MEFSVYIYPDGKVVHEVTKRQQGENCEKIRMFDAPGADVISDEKTGPDCDTVTETN